MPIEIKELVIRAVVADDHELEPDQDRADQDRAELVDACVQEVLRILRRVEER